MSTDHARPVIFGEVLFDSFPDGAAVLGGAPFNVAWHLQGFGLQPLFVSRVGDDERGREVLDAMDEWGMDTAGVQVDPVYPTGTVQVSLADGQPSFAILPDQAYDHIGREAVLRLLAGRACSVVYLGSLIARGPVSAAALRAVLAEAEAPAFIDVNLRPPWWDADGVAGLLAGARWAKLNDDELARLAGADPSDPITLKAAAEAYRVRNELELLVLTRGAEGAFMLSDAGIVEGIAAPVEDLKDTVGAGDAFSAVTLLGLSRGWSPADILDRALGFAAAVCGLRGATTRDRTLYTRHLAQWDV